MKIRIANTWKPGYGKISNIKNWIFTGFQFGITDRIATGYIHICIVVCNFEFDFEI